jgi:energy-coupling factor transporter ATP-binding protein EcfA2
MIELKNLSFKYKKDIPEVIKNINLTIKSGEKVLIAGKNGAGKTTLSKIMAGLMPRVEHGIMKGEYNLNGRDISSYTQKQLASEIAVLFQDFESQITAVSVKEELIFYPMNLGAAYERVLPAAEKLAAEFGLSGLMERDVNSLSGGEKQKIELLSLLITNPAYLILDEPFTDIDPASQKFILDFFKSGKFKGSLIVFEQSLDFCENFDRIIILNEGTVMRDGSRETAGDIAALREAGLEAPALVKICGGWLKPEYIAADLIQETKYFDPEAYEKVTALYAGSSQNIFEIKDLQYRYPGSREYALTCVNLAIKEGDFVSVVGANGSGKTTLMKILAGIYDLKKGNAYYKTNSVKTDPVIGKIGYVYQNPDNQIFCETVFDELAFALRTRGVPENELTKKVENMMDIFDITDKRQADPFSLPKGDRQKIACASVLIMWPDVMILDEPTTGLDMQSLERLMKVILDINRAGKTVIMITHYMDVASRYGNTLIAMNSGRVVYCGDKRKFFESDEFIREAGAVRTDIMNLSLDLNGKLLLNEDEFNLCWKEK